MNWYCDVAPGHPVHGPYHDHEYGVPVRDDRVLFERLSLEIFQAGLSWLIVLKKRPALVAAFDGFEPTLIARYGEADVVRLMADPAIIRNRRKIEAVISNARRVMDIRAAEGTFAAWIARHHPQDRSAWIALFGRTFAFTGKEVVGEFLISIGILPGAHRPDCPAHARILDLDPPWRHGPSKS